jgi:hypothetical protein
MSLSLALKLTKAFSMTGANRLGPLRQSPVVLSGRVAVQNWRVREPSRFGLILVLSRRGSLVSCGFTAISTSLEETLAPGYRNADSNDHNAS